MGLIFEKKTFMERIHDGCAHGDWSTEKTTFFGGLLVIGLLACLPKWQFEFLTRRQQ